MWQSLVTFCLPVFGGCGLCQPCSWLLGSWFLPPRLPSYQVGISKYFPALGSILQKENIVTCAILFLLGVVSRRTMVRGRRVVIIKPTSPPLIFELHSPLLATTSMTRFVFELSIFIWHLNLGLCFSGCNWILHLGPACRSDVRHPLRARWPWAGLLFQGLPWGQVISGMLVVNYF